VIQSGRGVVGVLDTYPSLGWNGHHLQPADAVAEALNREDGHEGGILCICRAEDAVELHEQLPRVGCELRDWDNGSDGR
jgi:hypothetical protein